MKTYIIILSLLLINIKSTGQELKKGLKPSISFLGTFHFAGSNDVMSLKVNDIKSDRRQEEIQLLVKALTQYNPTKVILEYPFGNTSLDSVYQQYLKGSHLLTIDERQQIGFRLAKEMKHPHIYVADHPMELPFNELNEYLNEVNQSDQLEELIVFWRNKVMTPWQNTYETSSIIDFFRFINQEEYDRLNKNVYLQHLLTIGDGRSDIAARLVSKWWERNFRIVQNIDALIEPDDRVLVIFGQGHTAILKDIYKSRTNVHYVDIIEFLR